MLDLCLVLSHYIPPFYINLYFTTILWALVAFLTLGAHVFIVHMLCFLSFLVVMCFLNKLMMMMMMTMVQDVHMDDTLCICSYDA